MATVAGGDGSASGAGRGRDPGEEGEQERVREVRGGAWRRSGRPGRRGRGQAGRWLAGRVAARAGRVPLSSWREEGDDWHCQSAGPACWPLGQARLHREVSAGGFLPFCFYFVFVFYFLTFVLI